MDHQSRDIRPGRAFQALRDEVHRRMERNLQARLAAGNGQPTEFEMEIEAYEEEIEPQVLGAVKELNRKNDRTVSSGFAGPQGERQQIDGLFTLEAATRAKLALLGVSVSPYPASYVPGTMLFFYPPRPDLAKIAAKWDQVAHVLPDLTRELV